MKTERKEERAAVLVFAVLILTAGVFVLTAIAQLGATQAVIGRDEWLQLDRRVTLQNSRALARQFVLARMFRGVISNEVEYSDSGLGGFEIEGDSATDYWNNPATPQADANLKINPFNPMERGGFFPALLSATLTNGTNTENWRFLVRTRSPIAAGYSYVRQSPADVPDLEGFVNVVFVEGDEGLRFVAAADGVGIPNVPMSSTTNTNSNDTNGYQGSFAVPISAGVLQGFNGGVTNELVDPNNPTVRVVVDLAVDGSTLPTSDDGLALRYDLPQTVPMTFTNNATNPPTPTTANVNVTELLIEGSIDGLSQPALLIVVTNHPHLTNIILSGSNLRDTGRRVYLHLEAPTNQVDFTANNPSTQWRLGISAKNCSTNIDFSGLSESDVRLVGGLRTDSGVPSLEVSREDDPGGLDYIADQMMWLEDYRVP